MAQRILALTLVLAGLTGAAFAADADWITVDELRDQLASNPKTVVFDARGNREYDAAHIRGAVLPLPLKYYNDLALFNAGVVPERPESRGPLRDRMAAFPPDTPIVTYCGRGCKASAALRDELKYMGFKDVRALQGGVEDWRDKGYPMEGASLTPGPGSAKI